MSASPRKDWTPPDRSWAIAEDSSDRGMSLLNEVTPWSGCPDSGVSPFLEVRLTTLPAPTGTSGGPARARERHCPSAASGERHARIADRRYIRLVDRVSGGDRRLQQTADVPEPGADGSAHRGARHRRSWRNCTVQGHCTPADRRDPRPDWRGPVELDEPGGAQRVARRPRDRAPAPERQTCPSWCLAALRVLSAASAE